MQPSINLGKPLPQPIKITLLSEHFLDKRYHPPDHRRQHCCFLQILFESFGKILEDMEESLGIL